MNEIPQGSEAYRRLNPHVFSVAKLRAEVTEPDQRSQGQDSALEAGAASPRYSVTITVFRRRLLDGHDNAAASCKQVADHITAFLGLDDDRLIDWEFHQVKSRRQGTHVLINH